MMINDCPFVGIMGLRSIHPGVGIITEMMDDESTTCIVPNVMLETRTDEMSKKPWRSGMEISSDVFECPYCGHKKAEMKKRSGFKTTYYVLCGRCGARGPMENSIIDASMWWRFA